MLHRILEGSVFWGSLSPWK